MKSALALLLLLISGYALAQTNNDLVSIGHGRYLQFIGLSDAIISQYTFATAEDCATYATEREGHISVRGVSVPLKCSDSDQGSQLHYRIIMEPSEDFLPISELRYLSPKACADVLVSIKDGIKANNFKVMYTDKCSG